MIPGSLLPHFNCDRNDPRENRPAHLHFPNKTNCRCAQIPNNSCTSAVGTSPLQYPTLRVRLNSVRSLLRQPRSALEAGPSEARAISFVHTPRPHLHQLRYAFSRFFCAVKGIMGKSLIGLKRHPFSGPVDSVGELLHTP